MPLTKIRPRGLVIPTLDEVRIQAESSREFLAGCAKIVSDCLAQPAQDQQMESLPGESPQQARVRISQAKLMRQIGTAA